jgi:maltokinase
VSVPDHLASQLEDVDPGSLLPPRRGDVDAVETVRLCDALPLGDGIVVAVFAAARGFVIAPLIARDGEPIRRARAGDGVFERLLRRLANGESSGRFTFEPVGDVPFTVDERAIDVDQSNESVVVGERAVVKLYPRSEPGPHPGLDLPVHLVSAGFTSFPTPFGTVAWRDPGGEQVLLATASAFLPGATDGWHWYLELLLAWLRGDVGEREVFEPASSLGGLTGRLHVALATPSRVIPRPVQMVERETVATWKAGAEGTLDRALDVTDGEPGDRLHMREGRIRAAFGVFDEVEATHAMRVHGDLHVGQFLHWSAGTVIADFDGNPLASAGQRVALDTPVRDVAALLRSIDHLGRIAQRREAGYPEAIERWIARSREDLLQAYFDVLDAWGQRSLYEPRLLFPLEVAQECHEFVYAARYLPIWVGVPDLAVCSLFP